MREDEDIKTEVEIRKPPTVNFDTKNVKSTTKWKPPVLLPLDPNFLRLHVDSEYVDEFAVMLQNEEFLAELR